MMVESRPGAGPAGGPEAMPSFDAWQLAATLLQRRRFILGATLLGAAAAVAISLLLPNWYTASARVLPPEQGSINPLSAALARGLPSAASSLLGGTSGEYARYLTILSSRRMYEGVVDRFKLVEVYDIDEGPTAREEALRLLMERAEFPVDEEMEFLAVAVTDRDPQRAADMANFFVSELNRINAELSTQSAGSYRRFVQGRYEEAQGALDSVLTQTQEFQRRYGLFDVPSQVEAFYTSLAEMRSKAVESEIQYEALKAQLGPDNAQVRALADVVRASKEKVAAAMAGQEQLLPVARENMPVVMRRYLDLQREGVVQGRILEVVGPLLEQARFDEEHQAEAVQVVDQAVPPVKKASPKRSIIVIVATLSVLVLAVVLTLALEWWRRSHAYVAHRLRLAARAAEQAPAARP